MSRSFLLPVLVATLICSCLAPAPAPSSAQVTSRNKPFPDFGYLPPPDRYSGRVFRLKQDYPETPPQPGRLPPFFKTDFQKDWKAYMHQVRAYCFEGNVEVDWRVEDNRIRAWYHVPWQHYGPNG